jgi:hypothetical protein
MSIIFVIFEYLLDSIQDVCILKDKISVEYIVPSHRDKGGDNDFGDNQREATGFFPQMGIVLKKFY